MHECCFVGYANSCSEQMTRSAKKTNEACADSVGTHWRRMMTRSKSYSTWIYSTLSGFNWYTGPLFRKFTVQIRATVLGFGLGLGLVEMVDCRNSEPRSFAFAYSSALYRNSARNVLNSIKGGVHG